MLENETFENFFAKSAKKKGEEGSDNCEKKSAISDKMHLWMTPKETHYHVVPPTIFGFTDSIKNYCVSDASRMI